MGEPLTQAGMAATAALLRAMNSGSKMREAFLMPKGDGSAKVLDLFRYFVFRLVAAKCSEIPPGSYKPLWSGCVRTNVRRGVFLAARVWKIGN